MSVTKGGYEAGFAIEWGWIQINSRHDGSRIGYTKQVDLEDVTRALHEDAAATIGPGKRYQICKKLPSNYGRTHGMAWYHNEAFEQQETWGATPEGYNREGGFYLVGEFTTS